MAKISIIEGLSLPGSPDRANEDAYGATSAIAFVLDGVTGLADAPVVDPRSDAAWVSHAARDLLVEHGHTFDGDMRALVGKVAQGIVARFERERLRVPTERYELPWTTLSIIGVTPGKLHFGYLGDSRTVVETSDDEIYNIGAHKTRTTFEQNTAARVVAASKEHGLGMAAIRATVMPEMRRARNTVNTPNGFWLLGADPASGPHTGVTTLTLSGPATVLLATDGFYALNEDYGVFDDRDLVATAQTIGLHQMAQQLRGIENEDPLGHKYPRMKKSDDATALLVRVEP